MISAESARDYHCPRWDELPAVPLYMDQVVIVVKNALSLFGDENDAIVTPAMINNYVKQRLIEPAQKKKYGRHQIARLVVVNFFKKVFSMQEILAVINTTADTYGIEIAYNMFCEELEKYLVAIFANNASSLPLTGAQGDAHMLMQTALISLLCKLDVQNEINKLAK